ncbi:hypothetical protein [Azonexus sp.]|uniref:hypothetical protein n=1 Tax=Azonexus sp. TaxID=1872668 RepID=UPI0035B29043
MTMKPSIAGAGHAGLFNARLLELTTLAVEQTLPPQMQDSLLGCDMNKQTGLGNALFSTTHCQRQRLCHTRTGPAKNLADWG